MDYAQQLAFFADILEQKRLVTALEGNASIIDRETGLTYITPSGRMKLLLQRAVSYTHLTLPTNREV